MAVIGVEQLKKNIKLKIDGQPHTVTDFNFTKPGKGQAVYRCKLKNLITGNTFDRSWRSGDNVEKADLSTKQLIFSYIEDNAFVFMDGETYDQVMLSKDVVGENEHFLIDDGEVEVLFFEDKAIDVQMPNFVVKPIHKSDPGVKGDTATNVTKPAYTDTGLELHVPIFINEGDLVKIDTRNGEYVERVNAKK